ncbi:reverse transcriptase-like protein [Patescibacteria group bacterium]|nr:reverse transcriptase-like protein [Patescibacteria group bacterium]
MQKVLCSVAGDAKGNPGPGAFGVCVTNEGGEMIAEVAREIGNASADFATYNGVMVGLQTLVELYDTKTTAMSVELCLDNELVKKQLNAELPLHDPGLVPMFMEIHNNRVTAFPNLTIILVTADKNASAQQLVKEVLDAKA